MLSAIMLQDVPLPDDLDGEALGEDEFPEAAVPRTLDDELERAATPAESSVLPAARCVEMDAILQGQQRNLAIILCDSRVPLAMFSASNH